MRKPVQKLPGATARQVNQVKDWQKGQSVLQGSLAEDQSYFILEWVKWSEDRKEKFPEFFDMRLPWNVVPKPTGEALTQATIRLKEYRHVRIYKIMKIGIFNKSYVQKLCQLYLNILWEWLLCLARNISLTQYYKTKTYW